MFNGFSGLGSGSGQNAESENVLPFKAKLQDGEDPADFTVSVANQGAGVKEVRESVRFEGTKYCLNTNGSSDIDWALGDETGDWAFTQDGDVLVFSGRCVGR